MIVAAVLAWLIVVLRRPRVERQPVDPSIGAHRRRRRARRGARRAGRSRPLARLRARRAGRARRGTARMSVAPLGPGAEVSAGYRIPTERRGVLTIGPLTAAPPGRPRAGPLDDRGGRRRRGPRLAPRPPPRHAAARPGRARPSPPGPGPTARARRLPQPARLRRRATNRARSTGGPRPARRTSRSASTASRGCGAASCCSTSTSRPASTARTLSSEPSPPPPASCTAPIGPVSRPASSPPTAPTCADPTSPPTTLHLLARIGISEQPAVPVERDPARGSASSSSIAHRPVADQLVDARRQDPTLTPIGVFTMDLPHRTRPAGRRRPQRDVVPRRDGRRWPAAPATGGRREPRRPDPVLAEVAR